MTFPVAIRWRSGSNARHATYSVILCFSWPFQAAAQQTDDNATRQSEDAFGTQVGSERTGLYSSNDIRGFDPVDSGNVRLAELYFDQVDMLASTLIDRTRIRVGLSSQGFAFPAPSGLVDYALNLPGPDPLLSAELSIQNNWDRSAKLEFSHPLTPALFLGGGGERSIRVFSDGRSWHMTELSGALVFAPRTGFQLTGFVSSINSWDNEARPAFVPDGDFLPPRTKRGRDLSQPWADQETRANTLGMMLNFDLGKLRFEGGVFRDAKYTQSQFADVLNGVSRDGAVKQRTIIADGNNFDRSISGEVRVSSNFEIAEIVSKLTLSVRGRRHEKAYGGAQRIDLGVSTILMEDQRKRPGVAVGLKSNDQVKQLFLGVSYAGRLNGRTRLDGSLSRTFYSKIVTLPDAAVQFEARDRQWLWNALISHSPLPGLTVFGGWIRSMEEAPVAPDRAINRAESPPAIQTRQEELGFSFSPGSQLTGSFGIYRISKPYYNLDSNLRYRLLGKVIKKGIEISLVSNLSSGLTVLGGVMIGSPKVTGEAVDLGQIGRRPAGESSTRITANVDWRLDAGRSPFSLDAGFRKESGRFSSSANTFKTPGNVTFDIGGRFRFNAADTTLLLRLRIQNVLNSYAWNVSRGGSYTYTNPRRATVQLSADF